MTNEIENILNERGSRYGDFVDHARITQAIKQALYMSEKWNTLGDDKKEALEMIAHKMGRIVNGDPEYKDSWDDIAGYATLVAKKLDTIYEVN